MLCLLVIVAAFVLAHPTAGLTKSVGALSAE